MRGGGGEWFVDVRGEGGGECEVNICNRGVSVMSNCAHTM